MSTLVERAIAGHMKSMQELYSDCKKELYAFCCFMVQNTAKAKTAAENTISEVWSVTDECGIVDEADFRALLLRCAAKQCRKILFGKDSRAFRLSRVTAFTTQTILEEEYTDDIPKGTNELMTALNRLDAPKRFVYLLRTIGRFSEPQIAEIIGQREEVVRYDYAMALRTLQETLTDSLTPAKVASLYAQAVEKVSCPQDMDQNCAAIMQSRAVSSLPPKKVMFGMGIGIVCLAIVLIAAATSGNSDPTSADNDLIDGEYTDELVSDDNEILETTALDTSLTYYADISVADYGTITVLLDDESAPITVENFVTLAESGFYDGLTFHRIIDGFMMQGGDPNGDGTGGAENTIVGEFSDNGYDNSLSHTAGAISMARSSDYDSASSQFFIVHEDSTYLDGQYAVFGYVTDEAGMEIVDAICTNANPTDDNGTIPADEQPVITSIVIRTESKDTEDTGENEEDTDDVTDSDLGSETLETVDSGENNTESGEDSPEEDE